ncbi:aldo/keto reductase [Arthrobacter sp. AL08]|uniref:aldo/keto reductase n=2 Tax=Micrococcales TaxID=85006 RepID=UPI00249AA5B6|nr:MULTISPECIES: aldo/keto reductase [Micrococcaceae]MDI3241783.1 aldo/keto reductase [Arthrobacter sp. AL05]MDI3277893.1 aldo/keto reductase [Arthrobacter sp. AL08]MDJ0351733.1 aldo/keto reductase [Pseudarthrobacter sp. PH31-O2]WGZ81132.1 aldo/keto reductase [Arthrobacter sp. EM1]
MQQRYVGNSGLRVSSLSLGTMSWSRETDEQDASALLRTFLDGGGTLLDTAASYGEGRAEAMLGGMLGDVVARSEVVISTKAGLSTADGRRSVDTSRNGMLAGLDASLARLGTDYVDLWFAQAWDPNVPLEETLSALEFAVRSGRARYAGVSNFNGWQTAKAAAVAGFPLVANQSEYSLLCRSPEAELIPAVEDAGLGLMAWGAMGRGVLSGKYRGQIPADSRAAQERLAGYVEPYLEGSASSVVEAVAMAAKGLGRTAMDVALSWLLSQHGVATAVVGPRTPVQLKEILDATLAPLPPQIAQALEDVSRPV